ncbi:MAG: ABC transporter permease subunit, partial [Bacilli bacterium]|nr:ABC transporter permease subunit [Bacilli bacterium]
MKNSLHIVKKELDKIFKSPKLIFSTFLLSPLLIFVIYSLMGSMMSSETERIVNEKSVIGVINVVEMNDDNQMTTQNQYFYQTIAAYNTLVEANEAYTLEKINIDFVFYPTVLTYENFTQEDGEPHDYFVSTIENETIDLWVFYDAEFDDKVSALSGGGSAYPVVQVMLDSGVQSAGMAMEKMNTLFAIEKNIILTELSIEPNVIQIQPTMDLVDERDVGNRAIAMLVPMLVIIFIFASGMGIGADLIAGEKERGTISTLLMTPINKNEIVFGKIIAGIILTTISAVCSAVGMILSVGNMLGVQGAIQIDFIQAIQLLIAIVLIAFFAISLFLAASTIASSVKEASLYIMPFYIIAMVVSFIPMFAEHIPGWGIDYIIPIYNVALVIKGILLSELTAVQFLTVTLSTIVYFIIILIFVTKLFRTERIMF